jgi:Holliday junction resolvasome RuvABC endonuclease subunit
MKVLGIKCSKEALGWIVLEGTARSDATIVSFEREDAPSGERGEQLLWAQRELIEIITKHAPDLAALQMSEGPNALAERSQMDGVILATLHQKNIRVTRLFSSSIRSKFSGLKKAEVAIAVAALPACTPNATSAQRELLTVAVAIFPT